jgi:hypothetical protein
MRPSPHERSTGSFLDGAKYFSLGLCGSWLGVGGSGWVDAKPQKMQGLRVVPYREMAWPEACLILRQPEEEPRATTL